MGYLKNNDPLLWLLWISGGSQSVGRELSMSCMRGSYAWPWKVLQDRLLTGTEPAAVDQP